jgi:hypothetical protein
VPISGDSLVPATPRRPRQETLHALLGGSHQAPEEAPNLTDTQRHPSPRDTLKAVRLLGMEPAIVFFNGVMADRCAARSTVNKA